MKQGQEGLLNAKSEAGAERVAESLAAVIEASEITVREVAQKANKLLEQTKDNPKNAIRIRSLVANFEEVVRAYLKYVVLGGLVLIGPSAEHTATHKSEDLGERIKRARVELSTQGITSEQANAYKPIMSESLQRAITPWAYGNAYHAKEIIPNLIWGKAEARYRGWKKGRGLEQAKEAWKSKNGPREDAWRMYLGLPQEQDTFDISDYKPHRAKDDVYYYSIKNFWQNYLGIEEGAQAKLRNLFLESKNGVVKINKSDDAWGTGQQRGIMGNYTISFGKDSGGHYVSYYDKWDLAVSSEKFGGGFGKPFEIYDRLYYDPDTFKPMIHSTIVRPMPPK